MRKQSNPTPAKTWSATIPIKIHRCGRRTRSMPPVYATTGARAALGIAVLHRSTRSFAAVGHVGKSNENPRRTDGRESRADS